MIDDLKNMTHAYIAYEAKDYLRAIQFNKLLQDWGVKTWLDIEKIPTSKRGHAARSKALTDAFAILIVLGDETKFENFSTFEKDFLADDADNPGKRLQTGIICRFGTKELASSLPFDALGSDNINTEEETSIVLLMKYLAERLCKANDKGLGIPPSKIPLKNSSGTLFEPDDVDLYVNRKTGECYIFYGKKIDEDIERIEFYRKEKRIMFVYRDGRALDLGVPIQWLIRPTLAKANRINVALTKNGKVVSGVSVPVIHLGPIDELMTMDSLFRYEKSENSKTRVEALDQFWLGNFK